MYGLIVRGGGQSTSCVFMEYTNIMGRVKLIYMDKFDVKSYLGKLFQSKGPVFGMVHSS